VSVAALSGGSAALSGGAKSGLSGAGSGAGNGAGDEARDSHDSGKGSEGDVDIDDIAVDLDGGAGGVSFETWPPESGDAANLDQSGLEEGRTASSRLFIADSSTSNTN